MKNEGLEAKVDAMNKQMLELQQNLQMSSESQQMQKMIVHLQAAVQVYKQDEPGGKSALTPDQVSFLEKREATKVTIENNVSRFRVNASSRRFMVQNICRH